jgi:hypothetical protein
MDARNCGTSSKADAHTGTGGNDAWRVQRGTQHHPKRQPVEVDIAACPLRLNYSTGVRRKAAGEVVTKDLWLVQVRVLGTTQAPWLLLTDWPVEDEQSALRIFMM